MVRLKFGLRTGLGSLLCSLFLKHWFRLLEDNISGKSYNKLEDNISGKSYNKLEDNISGKPYNKLEDNISGKLYNKLVIYRNLIFYRLLSKITTCSVFVKKISAFSSQKTIKLFTTTFSGN